MEKRSPYVEPAQYDKRRRTSRVMPLLGSESPQFRAIEAPEILDALKRVDSGGVRFTPHRLRSGVTRVFRYGIEEGFCKSSPARDLLGATPPAKSTHLTSITEPAKLARCFARSTALSTRSSCSVRSSRHRCCSCGPVNCDKRNGRNSTSTRQNGDSSSRRPRLITWSRTPRTLSRSCVSYMLSLVMAATSFLVRSIVNAQ